MGATRTIGCARHPIVEDDMPVGVKMAGLRTPWRRARLCALAAVTVLGASAGSAAAYDSFDPTTDAPVTFDADSHWWNGLTLQTRGNYQFSAYWDAEDGSSKVPLKLTRRNLSARTLEHIRFDGTGGFVEKQLPDPERRDGHNAIIVGLSPNDGRVHISWSEHSAQHQYGISSAGCMTQARLSDCRFTFTTHQVDRTNEATLTYPFYFNDSRGRLYFSYRRGTSLDSDQLLNTYNDAGTWTGLGKVFDGSTSRSFDVDGTWTDTNRDRVAQVTEPGWLAATTRRGIYPYGWEFDKNDRLHVMWAWRERGSSGVSINHHGIYYAYSDDFGRTWSDTAGRAIGTTSSDPIVVSDTTTRVADFPPGTYPLGYGIKIDPMNQPHLVTPSSAPSEGFANFVQTHVWRTPGGGWYSRDIATEGGSWTGYGDLMFDRSGSAYYTYNRYDLDWVPWNAVIYQFDELFPDATTWQGGEYLNIVPTSAVTALDTFEYIGIPIGIGSSRDNRQISISLKNNTVGTAFQIYWQTDADPTWTAGKGQSFTIRANRAVQDQYTFQITDADWTGTLRALEIYPAGLGDVHGAGKDISIDWIRIHDDAFRYAKVWEFRKGVTVKVTEAGAGDNWATWRAFEFPGISDAQSDAVLPFDDQLYKDSKVVSFATTEQGAPGTESVVVHNVDILGDDMIFSRDFAVDVQAWTAGTDVGSFAYASDGGRGTISGSVTGADSRIYSEDNLQTPIEGARTLRVRLKNTTSAREAKLYFVTNASTSWSEGQSVSIPITANSTYTTYTVDISRATNWRTGETLRQLRFDPANDASSGSFNLNSIELY
jgi:hypothetical protein